MREFNSLDVKKTRGQVQPLVYGTFQAYLRRYGSFFFIKKKRLPIMTNRTPAQLALALADARANNYALGVKLVRGAYHPHEVTAHKAAASYDKAVANSSGEVATARPPLSISPDVEPPVWMEKRETDEAYNGCLKVLIEQVRDDVKRCEKVGWDTVVEKKIKVTKKGWLGLFSGGGSTDDTKKNEILAPSIGVLFGTHNWNSCNLVLKNLVDTGLAVAGDGELAGATVLKISDEAVERIAIGQLYGVSFEFDKVDLIMFLFSKGCVMI